MEPRLSSSKHSRMSGLHGSYLTAKWPALPFEPQANSRHVTPSQAQTYTGLA